MKLLALFPLLLFAGEVPHSPALRILPPEIAVGATYSGADVRIEGTATAGSNLIIVITGSDREERFNRKGRFGPIWITAGRLRISGVPSVFLRFSSEPVTRLLAPEAIASLRLDAAALQAAMHIEPRSDDPAGDAAIRQDYLALKNAEGVYSFVDGTIGVGQPASPTAFLLEFRWPKKAPPGTYQVRLYQVRNGSVIDECSMPFAVVRTGFPKWLSGLAENRASLYGAVAVLVATLAGFGIDFLTTCLLGKKKRTAAH